MLNLNDLQIKLKKENGKKLVYLVRVIIDKKICLNHFKSSDLNFRSNRS